MAPAIQGLTKYRVLPVDWASRYKKGSDVPDEECGESWWFWCPGCDTHHMFSTKLSSFERKVDAQRKAEGHKGLPVWTMKVSAPGKETFHPSLKYPGHKNEKDVLVQACHLHVKDGMIDYCDDGCSHKLQGKKRVKIEGPR